MQTRTASFPVFLSTLVLLAAGSTALAQSKWGGDAPPVRPASPFGAAPAPQAPSAAAANEQPFKAAATDGTSISVSVGAAGALGMQLQWQGEPLTVTVRRPGLAPVVRQTAATADKAGRRSERIDLAVTAEDLRRGRDWIVEFRARGSAAGTVSFQLPAGSKVTGPAAGGPVASAQPAAPARPEIRQANQAVVAAITAVKPVISGLRLYGSPNNPNPLVRPGDTVVVEGTGLDGIGTVTVSFANNTGTAAQPNWVVNTAALRNFSATATTLATTDPHFGASYPRPTEPGLKFTLPDIPPTIAITAPMVVTVTRGTASAISKNAIMVGQKPTERKITSVEQTAVRAGGRVKIHGLGFNDVPGPGGYAAVRYGYFGQGTPGSATNPAITTANVGADYVELWLPKDCDQYGLLMLAAPRPGGGSDDLVVATPPIYVGCAKADPTGRVIGTEGAPNGMISVAAGSSVTIRGTGLRFVSKVVDQTNLSFPFTFTTIGSGPSAFDQLTVSLAPAASGRVIQFYLQSTLTDPVMSGTVSGIVQIQ